MTLPADDVLVAGTGLAGEALPAHPSGARAFGWWGMVWLIATEATLFALLLGSSFYLRFRSGPVWPPDGIQPPGLGLPLVMTAVLWSSSLPVHLADVGARRGDDRRVRWGLAAGFVLGAAFLVLTVAVEWPEQLQEFTPTTNVYGSLFFTITGFHAAHVLVGLLVSLWTQLCVWRGALGRRKHLVVQSFALYWHFVDVVWAFVLVSLYVVPNR